MQYYCKRFLSHFSHSKTNSFFNEQYYVNSILFLYLGFLMKLSASLGSSSSGIRKQRRILWESLNAFSGLAVRAALLVSGDSPNRVGTGPATTSPSNIEHSSGQAASWRHGTLSLNKWEWIFLKILPRLTCFRFKIPHWGESWGSNSLTHSPNLMNSLEFITNWEKLLSNFFNCASKTEVQKKRY